ncbi:MAG: nucleotidyl transferase AbiEii/AbiGii toxin family protein [Nocardioidaceae bacterium]
MIPRSVIQSWAAAKPWPTSWTGPAATAKTSTTCAQCTRESGPIFDAVREVAASVGLEVVSTRVGEHPKVLLRTASETDPSVSLKIKIEINTHETSPALPPLRLPFEVETEWFSGRAEVKTFVPEELIATKIRALHQRKKGRDLFDMWLAVTELGLTGDNIVAAFAPYRPADITAALSETNLREKLNDSGFRNDLAALVTEWPEGYDLDDAAELIVAEVLSKI